MKRQNVFFTRALGERIEFITFHQNYSYEDFIQGLRPDTEQGNQLTFERRDGVFMQMAVKALFAYYKAAKSSAQPELSRELDLNEAFLDFVQELKEKEQREFLTITGSIIELSDFTQNNNLEFKHQNRSRKYVVSASRLTKLYEAFPSLDQINNLREDIIGTIGGCNYTVYWVALKEFISFLENYEASPKPEEEEAYEEVTYETQKQLLSSAGLDDLREVATEDVPNYVIIIDEINRANISRVFGELITLIEPDKRSHGAIPLQCTLPSGEEFIVPSNLYLIGTMNTADKSIALLDIALRRRFQFEGMYPLYDIEGKEIYDKEILQKINAQIIREKGHDFQIGHAYFMDEGESLQDRMNRKVIPLLMEYFMNDDVQVEKILTSAGLTVSRDSWPLSIS
jgi:5-methylcytosine-specific restriction endonuclease McrBC GTP-binding regulatory subunit McrB